MIVAASLKQENSMPAVTSKDGTKIAFDKVGSGPAVILVNGAMSYRRAFDTTLQDLAELLGEHFTVYDYDRRQPLDDYEGHTTRLVAEGKLDELIEYFITVVAGIPAESVIGIKHDQAMWERMRAIAPTIPHDAAFMSEFMKGKPLPAGYWSKVNVPVLVGDGGASPLWLRKAAEALAEALPHARRKTFEGQTHSFDPHVLAPVIIEFFKK
jgi:pimeloyl-ACP methyl ester carboxylesterase